MERIDGHYAEEDLAAMLETPGAASDGHLESCGDCAARLEAFQLIAEALQDRSVWDTAALRTEPNRSTIATLRAFADGMADEEAYAEEVLPELLAGSRENWMRRLHAHPEWYSAGVIRKLIEAASSAIDTMPPDAVEMTALATEIADKLDPREYTADEIARASGAAWRERAYALFYVGSYAGAEAAVFASKRHFSECVASEYDLARVGIVQALVLEAKEQGTSAIDTARASTATFLEFEDFSRAVSAQVAEVHALFKRGDFQAAYAILTNVEQRMRRSGDTETHARVLSNLGYCCWKLGRTNDALQYSDAAAVLLENLGIPVESARVQWQVALLLASAGRLEEARSRFERLQKVFASLGMTGPATLVSLDIAELMLARGEFEAVEDICRAAMRAFDSAGVSYTARALTALAYMQEAAQLRTATPALVKHVREYIRQLPEKSNLLFAPPPP